MDDPVNKQLRCPGDHQVFLPAGYEVAVNRELHGGGSVGLPVHSVHPSPSSLQTDTQNTNVRFQRNNIHKSVKPQS